ncbi:MAG: Galactokinase [Candidatus Woesearchaeota archaeon]|nr:Galactokinase [Candidatus Woesearchaeota archaeon]
MIVTRTPVRVSIGGGGTDLPFYSKKHGGALVGGTIDKYIYIAVKKRFYKETRVAYSQIEEVKDNRKIKHPLVNQALRLLDIDEGMEITSIADVPSGTGLGSSGAFTVGLLNALHTYKGELVSKKVLAQEAHKIITKVSKGLDGPQDHYITTFGGISHMKISKKGSIRIGPVNLDSPTLRKLENNIMLFYTSIRRKTEQVLHAQKSAAKRDKEKIENLTRIKKIGLDIRKALEKGNARRFGQWLNVHWNTKRELSTVMTNPQIDKWYELALQNGALGGKIMGAGGGGFFMFYCDNHQEKFRKAMEDARLVEMPFKFDFDGTKVIFNGM